MHFKIKTAVKVETPNMHSDDTYRAVIVARLLGPRFIRRIGSNCGCPFNDLPTTK